MFSDPLTRLASLYPDFVELIRKREKKLLDYDALRSKAKRDPEREEEVRAAERIYTEISDKLANEMPILVESSGKYCKPCIEGYARVWTLMFEDFRKELPPVSSARNGRQKIDAVLNEMKALQIAIPLS